MGVLGKLAPGRLPIGKRQPDRGDKSFHLVVEGPADPVVVAGLQPELAVQRVLGRAGSAKDVHVADVPAAERLLGFRPGGG